MYDGYTRPSVTRHELESGTGSENGWGEDEVRAASARVEQLAGAVRNINVDGEDRSGSDSEEHSSQREEEEDTGLVLRCYWEDKSGSDSEEHSSQREEEEDTGLVLRCYCGKTNCTLNFDRERVETYILSV